MGALRCPYCLHESTKGDLVMHYWVGGVGDVARCVDDDKCIERQRKAHEQKGNDVKK